MHEHSTQVLREDLSKAKANYSDALRRENIVSNFRFPLECIELSFISPQVSKKDLKQILFFSSALPQMD
jgi:hypothetical protein